MRNLLTLLLILFSATLFAAEPVVIETDNAEPGNYYYKIVVDEAGAVSVHPIGQVLRLGVPPLPSPPPTPPPTTPTNTAQQVKEFTTPILKAEGSPTTALALAEVYSGVADKLVSTPGMTPLDARGLISSTTDTVLNIVNERNKWQPWRDNITDLMTKRQQAGTLTDSESHITLFRDVASGLKHAVAGESSNYAGALVEIETLLNSSHQGGHRLPPAKFIQGIDIVKLLNLIEIIMRLIEIFRP